MKNSSFHLTAFATVALACMSFTSEAQLVRNFAGTNIEVGGGFGKRLVNNTELGLLEGRFNVSTNGTITGQLTERFFANNQAVSSARNFNILAGSRVLSNGITATTNFYSSVSTNFSRSTFDNITFVSTNTHHQTVVRHRADFIINLSSGYLAKGRALAERETNINLSRSAGGMSWDTNFSRFVFLGGAIFKGNGEYVGPFNATMRLSQ
jgi:hypothetical protein